MKYLRILLLFVLIAAFAFAFGTPAFAQDGTDADTSDSVSDVDDSDAADDEDENDEDEDDDSDDSDVSDEDDHAELAPHAPRVIGPPETDHRPTDEDRRENVQDNLEEHRERLADHVRDQIHKITDTIIARMHAAADRLSDIAGRLMSRIETIESEHGLDLAAAVDLVHQSQSEVETAVELLNTLPDEIDVALDSDEVRDALGGTVHSMIADIKTHFEAARALMREAVEVVKDQLPERPDEAETDESETDEE